MLNKYDYLETVCNQSSNVLIHYTAGIGTHRILMYYCIILYSSAARMHLGEMQPDTPNMSAIALLQSKFNKSPHPECILDITLYLICAVGSACVLWNL